MVARTIRVSAVSRGRIAELAMCLRRLFKPGRFQSSTVFPEAMPR